MSRAWTWRHAILQSSLPSATRLTLLAISCHMNDLGDGCYPSMELLAKETGLSKRSIITHIAVASQMGFLQISQHGFEGRKWRRNEYRAIWPQGGERVAPRHQQGGETVAQGGERNDHEVVKGLHSNIPMNLPENISGKNFSFASRKSESEMFDEFRVLSRQHPTMRDEEIWEAIKKGGIQ